MEPLVGSILGAIVGVQGMPGLFTFLGCPVVLIGLIMGLYGLGYVIYDWLSYIGLILYIMIIL